MSKKSRKKRTQAKANVVATPVAAPVVPQATMAEVATGRAPIEESYGHVRGELKRIATIAVVLAVTLVVLSLVL